MPEFFSRNAFTITDEKTYRSFEKEFESLNSLLLSPGPAFRELVDRLRARAASF